MVDPNAYQQMQDEMSRFEAEISGVDFKLSTPMIRPVIGAGTFGVVQQQLERGSLPPPPPPPSFLSAFDPMAPRMMYPMGPAHMMVPHQVQRLRPPSVNMPPSGPDFPHFMRPNMPGPQMLPPQLKPQPVVLAAAPKLYKQSQKQDDKEKAETQMPVEELPPVVQPEPVPIIPPKPPIISQTSETQHKPRKEKKSRKVVRTAGGQVWEDVTLLDWPDDDFRMFCGDLGNDVSDELLIRTFSKYSSFQRAKVIRDKRTNKSKGFGFVSFKEPTDFIKAMKEMDGRYVGSRPIKLRKSTWKNRALDVVRKKEKEKAALLSLMMSGGKS